MAEQKNEQAQDINQLLKIRRDKLKELQENGKDPFTITKYDVTHHSQEIKDQFDELEGQEVSIAGRLMSKRVMGKASFCNVQDLQGNIQSYVARDSIGEDARYLRRRPERFPFTLPLLPFFPRACRFCRRNSTV